MEKILYMYAERIEGKQKQKIFESYDVESITSWTITALFDGAVKRCKIKINQYYIDDVELCEIIATYTRTDPEYNEIKEKYVIKNWRNDWGNFINVYKTLKDNNIEILKSEVK